MELTQEHFDQVVSTLATKEDLKPLATKEQIEERARMVSAGFEDIQQRLGVRDKVERHEVLLKELARQAGLKLDW